MMRTEITNLSFESPFTKNMRFSKNGKEENQIQTQNF